MGNFLTNGQKAPERHHRDDEVCALEEKYRDSVDRAVYNLLEIAARSYPSEPDVLNVPDVPRSPSETKWSEASTEKVSNLERAAQQAVQAAYNTSPEVLTPAPQQVRSADNPLLYTNPQEVVQAAEDLVRQAYASEDQIDA